MATNNAINTNIPIEETKGGTAQSTYTTGDTLYASATNTLSKLAIATLPGQLYDFNGTSPAWSSWLQEVRYSQDFIAYSTVPTEWRNFLANGGDLNFPIASDNTHPGVVQLTTNTNTAGSSYYALGYQSTTLGNIILGGGSIDLYQIVQIPTLSDGTNTFEVSFGFGDSFNFSNTSPDNGVFFNYSSTINSGQWQLSTSAATVTTTSNTATAVTTNWTTLRININAAGTLCTFYVNGTSVGTISTNIPTTTISPFFTIAKSAGTSARVINIDLVYMYQLLTNTR